MESALAKQQPVIYTPDQRLRVFISSTLEELAPERMSAKKAVTNLHLTPVMFELGARPYAPRDLYSSYLAQSHIFIGIYGEKYGWIIPGLNISGLEDEFILSSNHPRLIYIKQNAPKREARLKLMVDAILSAGVSCKFFSDNEELCSLIENDLALLLTERFEQNRNSLTAKSQQAAVPVPPTPIIGRDEQITGIKRFLLQNDTHLVTLTGTGGIGKTRMALEVAHQMQNDFNDGVYFVSLSSVNDAALVPATVVQTVFPGELAAQPPLEVLTKLFFGKKVLLVLDNFEQVIGAASFVAELLRACRELKVLITSREVLRIAGEQEFPVPMLALPDADGPAQTLEELKNEIGQCSSVQLFVQRAKAINPSFELTKENAPAIAEICISLDGLPLAIELAAARVRILTPQAMLPHLGKRLSLLTVGNRDLPERHKKLSATIDWSYLMLLPEEQKLLCSLSVFSGGCTMQSAYAVAGDNKTEQGECPRMAMFLNNPAIAVAPFSEPTIEFFELMESLTAKNLIYRLERGGEMRFMMYETIKEYAQEQLGKSGMKAVAQKNHFNCFLRLAENLWGSLFSRNAAHSFQVLDSEIDNMRTALHWGLEHNKAGGLRLALALGEYWDTRGMPDEQIWWTENFLRNPEANTSPVITALAKIELARAFFREGKHDMSKSHAEEVADMSRQLGNKYLLVDSAMVQAMVAAYNGNLGSIKALIEEALAASRGLNYQMGTINLLQSLAAAANMEGRFKDVILLSDESLVLAGGLGATRWETIGNGINGFSYMSLGDVEASAASFLKALECSKRFMDSVLVVYPLIGMAQVSLFRGKADSTIKLLGAAEKLCERKGTAIVPMVRQIISMIQKVVKAQVGDEGYQHLYEIGCALQLNEAIEIAEA